MDWTLVDAFKNYVFSLDGKDQMELVRCLGSLGGILLTLYLGMSVIGKTTKWLTLGLYKGTKFVSVKSFRLIFPERKLSRICKLILEGMDKAKEGQIRMFPTKEGFYTLITDNAAFVDFNDKYNVMPARISPVTGREGQHAHINSLDVLNADERAIIYKKLKEIAALWKKQVEKKTKDEAEAWHRAGLIPPVPNVVKNPNSPSTEQLDKARADAMNKACSFAYPVVSNVVVHSGDAKETSDKPFIS